MSRVSLSYALAHCQPGQVLAANQDGAEVAVACTAGGHLAVMPDRCPHQYAPLSEGYVEGDSIICPRHNWEFSLIDGTIVIPGARTGCPGIEVAAATPDGLLDPHPRSR